MTPNPPLSKRSFLGMSGGMAALAAASTPASGARVGRMTGDAGLAPPLAGNLDLNEIPVIDTHMHPLARASITAKYAEQANDFADAVLPVGPMPDKKAIKAKLKAEYDQHVMGVSRRIGYFNYVSRIYGVPATLEGFDAVLAAHSGSEAAFAAYTRSVLDRENIACVVLQSRETAPVRPMSAIPQDRFVWTYRFTDMIGTAWAQARGLSSVGAVAAEIERIMATAVANGCRGFKNDSAYYRPLAIAPVSQTEAQRAMDLLLAATPLGKDHYGIPQYQDPDANRAVRIYQDYIFKRVYLAAGSLGRPIIIHSAVALHPALRPAFNDPTPLYDVLTDPAIVAAGTHFVIIHTGFPNHAVLAAMNSQFTRLHVDISHISKYPGILEEALRTLIGLGPTSKIMHGSDTGTVPEEIGYCAFNTRQVLGRVLSDYKNIYGWSQFDISAVAKRILNDNAYNLFFMK